MAVLNQEHKTFIIRMLARYSAHEDVKKNFRERFDMELADGHISYYNPENRSSRLSSKLQEVFYRERDRYLNEFEDLPLTKRAVRLRELTQATEMVREKAQQTRSIEDIKAWADCIMKIHRVMQDIESGDSTANSQDRVNEKRFYQQINQNVYFNK
ncbi:MAG: DUF2280 domain-containing protein [Cyclonatronaceae bacterium]